MALTGTMAGWKGQVILNAAGTDNAAVILLEGTRWNLSWRVEDLDTTAFDDVGYRTVIPGVTSADITIEGFWNTSGTPGTDLHGTGAGFLNIVPGFYAVMKLFIDSSVGGGNDFYRIPRAMCCDFNCDTDVHGVVKWTASFKSHGRFFSSFGPGTSPLTGADSPTSSA